MALHSELLISATPASSFPVLADPPDPPDPPEPPALFFSIFVVVLCFDADAGAGAGQ